MLMLDTVPLLKGILQHTCTTACTLPVDLFFTLTRKSWELPKKTIQPVLFLDIHLMIISLFSLIQMSSQIKKQKQNNDSQQGASQNKQGKINNHIENTFGYFQCILFYRQIFQLHCLIVFCVGYKAF